MANQSDTTIPAEVWRPVIGREGLFEVSNLGRVRSLPRSFVNARGHKRHMPGQILRPGMDGARAHYMVGLSVGGVMLSRAVHVLVCSAFHGPKPSPKHLVAHWDGDGFNNAATNLRWATSKENSDDCRRHGRICRGEGKPTSKLTAADVATIRTQIERAEATPLEMAERFSITRNYVYRIISRDTWGWLA